MPDFDLRSSASFISSKEGDTPLLARYSLMYTISSCCLRVNIGYLASLGVRPAARAGGAAPRNKGSTPHVLVWFRELVNNILWFFEGVRLRPPAAPAG